MPQTIALVDDDRNILTSVSMALEAEGFAVRTYTDGAEALRGLTAQAGRSRRARHQDAAHGRHGAAARSCARPSGMPVIFLTSKDDEVDELLGLRMGADDYIKKPFSPAPADRAHPRAAAARASCASDKRDAEPGEPVIVRGDLTAGPRPPRSAPGRASRSS